MNARLIARCTGPRPFDGACGFLRRFGWCGHFVMVCRRRSVLIEPVLGSFTPAKSLLSLVAAIIFQELDIVDAAPAAAWNVNAVGLSRGCELGLARHGIFDRDRQAADLDVAFDPQRRVVRDLDFLRGEILDQPIVDELFERRGHGEGLEVRPVHGIDHRHVERD